MTSTVLALAKGQSGHITVTVGGEDAAALYVESNGQVVLVTDRDTIVKSTRGRSRAPIIEGRL